MDPYNPNPTTNILLFTENLQEQIREVRPTATPVLVSYKDDAPISNMLQFKEQLFLITEILSRHHNLQAYTFDCPNGLAGTLFAHVKHKGAQAHH